MLRSNIICKYRSRLKINTEDVISGYFKIHMEKKGSFN